ncbi:MAG: hypothetical protein KF744_16995 [Taibaiella sp.]|nr:hypothetical protein [Taibaiella sp.]
MNRRITSIRQVYFGAIGTVATVAVLFLNSCGKHTAAPGNPVASSSGAVETAAAAIESSTGKAGPRQVLTQVLTVAGTRPMGDNGQIEAFFNENAEFFTVTDAGLVTVIKQALADGKPLKVSFDPWRGELVSATSVSSEELADAKSRGIAPVAGTPMKIDFTKISDDVINHPAGLGVMNTTDPGLNNVIPDFTTAQLMFDYITKQCCALPGPYTIDHCISFQYCQDGCYARAHKMCWVINNKYKYGTKKIFSFANAGSDKLCVQAQKWGGCCIRWWYHVAPLVTVQTPTGPKAYVFDPAMFNQPVLLATWLHAQENPACAGSWTPHVTMINVQPTSSYAPSGSSGMTFSTDPTYSATNSTLTSYSPLVTCP